MPLQKNDFIEIEFIARVKDGEVFDSNIASELKKLNPKAKAKPFIFALGHEMFLKGVENFLIGKEVGKYKIELNPEDAFGKRDAKLVQMIPIKIFQQHNVQPIPGHSLNFDGKVGKILTVSGGRVLIDFNNPIAGKDVVYELKVLRKVEKLEEKIKSFIEFLFGGELKFEISDKKIILQVEKGIKQFAEMFEDKFKELFDLNLEVQENGGKEK